MLTRANATTTPVHLSSAWARRDRLASGLSQTPGWVANWARPIPVLRFVNLGEFEAEPEQPVLLVDRPGAGKAEPLP